MNKKYLIFIPIAFSSFIFSCKKQLALTPTDTIEATKAYRNMADINLGLIGAYAYLGSSDITNTSLVSDECVLPNENTTGGGVATYRWQYDGTATTVTAAFSENYIAIDRINRVLAAIDVITTTPGEQALKDRYRGELLALRAYCHFELIRNFASKYETGALGVAYMEKSEISKPARLSFEASIEKVKADMAAAKPLIPSTFTDKTRITKAAIAAMQARVALYEKNWTDAITYSTEAISTIPLATRAQFPTIWKDQNDAEIFWKLKRASSADGLLGDFYFKSSIALYAPAYKLVNQFDRVNDIRFATYIKVDNARGAGKIPNLVNKYSGNTTANLADVKLYRTGEMLLIRAEAYAEKTQLTEAALDLNALRAARINGYASQTFTTKNQLIDSVYAERYKELAFEGHRFFDLKRRNLSIIRETPDAINSLGAILLTATQAQYAFPIPNSELTLVGTQMVQNPKY